MSDVGTVGQAEPTAVTTPPSTPTSADLVSQGIAKGGGWFGGVDKVAGALLPSTSTLGNVGLVAVGVVLAVGALLISQKETVVQLREAAP